MSLNKPIWGWSLYDWANSAFATVVIAGFFPAMFRQYWSSGLSSEASTFWLGAANSLASLLIVLAAPVLGALGDQRGWHKRLLIVCMLPGVVATLLLALTPAGEWQIALWLYMIGVIAFMASNIFYDAMLMDVSPPQLFDRVSGLGYAMGYLGGGLLLAFCVLMSQKPAWFGIDDTVVALQICFVLTAVWWLVFTVPLMFWVRESRPLASVQVRNVWRETFETLREIFRQRQVRLFLFAYWIYIDGVDTIIRMAVDYGMALGFGMQDLIMALLITQFIGFPAAILYSRLGERIGVKTALLLGLVMYAVITVLGYNMTSANEFYMLAVMIGLVQGGVQALSRSWYARMVPDARAAEYFGVYNMMGKAAAVLGPIMMGAVAVVTDSHRYSILSILILFIAGFMLLTQVSKPDQ
jgi:UMF1 family MFS transporter